MDPTPNENGVYSKRDADLICWPGATDRGVHMQIYVFCVDGVWLGGYSYQMGGADMRGGGSPLMKSVRYQHTARREALAHEARQLLRSIATSDCKHAPSIREWLNEQITGPAQPDLFAQAA